GNVIGGERQRVPRAADARVGLLFTGLVNDAVGDVVVAQLAPLDVFLPDHDSVAQPVGDGREPDTSPGAGPAINKPDNAGVHAAWARGAISDAARIVAAHARQGGKGGVDIALYGRTAARRADEDRDLGLGSRQDLRVGVAAEVGDQVIETVRLVDAGYGLREGGVNVLLLNVWQNELYPGCAVLAAFGPRVCHLGVGIVVVVAGQAELLKVVGALGARRRLADLLDGRQEQADEDGDDGDHHQELDQREPQRANSAPWQEHGSHPPVGPCDTEKKR